MNHSIAAMISVALLLISSLFVPLSYSMNADQTGSMIFDAYTDHDPIRIDSNQEFDPDYQGDTVYWLSVPPVLQKDQIANGLIDGGVSWEPYCSDCILSDVAHPLMWSGELWPNHPCCVLAVNANFAEDNPELVARTIAAHMEATDWIINTIENQDTEPDNYTLLLQMGAGFSERNTTTVAASLQKLSMFYDLNEQLERYLVNFTKDYIDLELTSDAVVTARGYSSVENFIDTFVDDSYMTNATTFNKSDTILGTVRLGYQMGDLHQFARVVAANMTMWDGTAHEGENLFTQWGVGITSPSPYGNSGAVMTAFDTDTIDMGYLVASAAIIKHLNVNTANSDIRIVAQANLEGSAIMVDENIDTVADLGGKLIATPGPTSIQHLLLIDYLNSHSMKFELFGTNVVPAAKPEQEALAEMALSSNGVTRGNGTADNPWVIEGWRIDASGQGYGIFIGNTTDHFIIRDCWVHNASGRGESVYYSNSGVILYNVTNGKLISNVLIDNQCGLSVSGPEDEGPIEVIDALGRTVVTDGRPSRIVSCSPAITEMIYALGLDAELVAVTDHCDWPADVNVRKGNGTLDSVGGYFTPSLEAIIVAEGDIVLLDQGVQAQLDMLSQLESLGVNVMVLHRGGSYSGIQDNIRMISQICWVSDNGTKLISSMEDRIAYLQSIINADVGGNLSFTDSRGTAIDLPAPAAHVASFGAFATSTLVDIGMLDKAVIFDAGSEFNKSAIPEMQGMPIDRFVTVSSSNKDVVVQTMLDLVDDGKWNKSSDFVLGYGYSYLNTTWAELESLGFKVMTFYPNSYDGVVQVVRDIETATGAPHGISRWMLSLPELVSDTLDSSGIDTAPERVRAMYVSYSGDILYIGNYGSLPTDMIVLAGGTNVGMDVNKSEVRYSADFSTISALQPELVLLDGYYPGTAEEFSTLINDTNITVFKLNKTWTSYCPDVTDGLWAVAYEMYPSHFVGTVPLGASIGPSAAFAVWLDPVYVGGNGTLANEMMTHALGTNVYSDLTGWPEVTIESLLERDPDHLLVSMMYLESPGEEIISDMENDTIWSELSAVQNKRVYIMIGQADSMFSRSGPRYVDAVEILAKIFYSDLFNTIVPHVLGSDYQEYLECDMALSLTDDVLAEEVPAASLYVNQAYHNIFIGNLVQATDDGSSCQWDAGYPFGGNYWSDYSGNDIYSGEYLSIEGPDGIGDSPYAIQGAGVATDRFPLMTAPGAPMVIAAIVTGAYVHQVMNGSSLQYYIVASGQNVTFTAAGSSDPDGDQLSYTWDFGDGSVVTTAEVTSVHSYVTPQRYTATLTVTDLSGFTASRSFLIKVDGVPPAVVATLNLTEIGSTLIVDQKKAYAFSSDPSVDMVNETEAGLIASYHWVWGDGNDTTVCMGGYQNVTHTWASAGIFQMFLNVTDVVNHTTSKAVIVTVRDTVPPTVRFSVKLNGTVVTSAKENQSLTFDASASSDVNGIASYFWEFGDGTNSTDDAPVHCYMEIKTFTVKLTLTDNAGNAANVTYYLKIESSPRPDLRVGYVTFDPTNFVEGEDGYVYVHVTNVGTATAAGICGELLAVNLDGNEQLLTNVSVLLVNGTEDTELLIGETGQLRFKVNFETRGNYSLTVNVIADNEVASKMTDNYATKALTVEGSPDDGDENDGYLLPFVIVSIIALSLFALLVLQVIRRKG